ncbi:hypothetical protein CDL12_00880 [Handroanthus impetiginosus]|uniref:Protein dehydration-induced 19 C-terminal domain-containing protein n=1 Tax=Handroanthus impetiginosus TaxID=429701 RepID=A0A2G9I9E0_9LAMI|nr:hypothetical protein CDL12_00880 [Handroanthus impetiginosus]
MDVDFWAARVHRHIPSVQSARLSNSGNHIVLEDEGSDEVRAWFPCPFCYVEIEVPLLCVHLQEEHCFDLKNARRRKSQKSGFWNNISTNIVKDLRELSSFLGTNSISGPGSVNEPAPDPLLSPFLCNVPLTVPKDTQKDVSSYDAATSDAESKKSYPPDEEEDSEEKIQRAAFVQELLFSTIF